MARNTSGQPWKFDATGQGEGTGTGYLVIGTFTSADTDITTMAGHDFATGDGPVRVTTSAADLPAGLATDTDYWIIYLSASTFSFASSLANAVAGTAVDITDAGTGTHKVVMLPLFNQPIYVDKILIETDTTAGRVTILDASGGRDLVDNEFSVNDRDEFVIRKYVNGVYVYALPTSAEVQVYHGTD